MLTVFSRGTFLADARIYSSSPFSMRFTTGITKFSNTSSFNVSSLSSDSLVEATLPTFSLDLGEGTMSSDVDDDDDEVGVVSFDVLLTELLVSLLLLLLDPDVSDSRLSSLLEEDELSDFDSW